MADDFARYIADMRQSFFDEKLLNGKFLKLEEVETINPGFVENNYAEYFKKSAKYFCLMERRLEGRCVNIPVMDTMIYLFKKSTLRVGAVKVTHQIDCMRECLNQGTFEECKVAFERVKHENEILRAKLESYFKLKRQGPPAEIEDRPEFGYMDTDSE